MARNVYRVREFRCTECNHEFRAGFWARKLMDTRPDQFGTRGDIHCPKCNSHRLDSNEAFLRKLQRGYTRGATIRESARPVVYRYHDAKGREKFRYPATNDPANQRPSEERVEFESLRSMERFLKEQNPTHRDWQVPLNDILDYDEAHIDLPALDTTDPGAAEDAEAIAMTDDFGVLDTPPSESDVKMTLVDTE